MQTQLAWKQGRLKQFGGPDAILKIVPSNKKTYQQFRKKYLCEILIKNLLKPSVNSLECEVTEAAVFIAYLTLTFLMLEKIKKIKHKNSKNMVSGS